MYLSTEELAALEERFGQPDVLWVRQAVSADELRTVRASRKFGRRHDVTLFIFDEAGRLAVIRKPFFPPGAYRAPSGGVRPGESILAGMVREGLEETGLHVEVDRYLTRVEATYTCGGESERWTSYVFRARAVGGRLQPIDREEIEEARWVTLAELQGPIRSTLLRSGRGLLLYRVALTDASVSVLDRLAAA